jgi:ubiquinone/menaquinone biosynthesis C-methylase UbiE
MKKLFGLILSNNFALADDWISHLLLRSSREQAIHMLRLQPMERLLIVGVGAGKDIPLLPPGIWITGTDSSAQKLQKARVQTKGHYVTLEIMDPLSLIYGDRSFNAVIFSPILGNETDHAKALREAWRVVRPGGRLVSWECSLKGKDWPSRLYRWYRGFKISGQVLPPQGLINVIEGLDDMILEENKPAVCNGNCRIILIRKENLK